MNIIIYLLTIVISILFLIPAVFCDNKLFTMLSGIGCSGLAAAIMAIFLEVASERKEKKRLADNRSIYFQPIWKEIKEMLENILWAVDRLEDPHVEWKDAWLDLLGVTVSASLKKETFHLSSAEEMEKTVIEKFYQLGNSQARDNNIHEMIDFLLNKAKSLLSIQSQFYDKRIELDSQKYLSLNEMQEINDSVINAIGYLRLSEKGNYQITKIRSATKLLASAFVKISKLGGYESEITILVNKC